MKGELGCSHPNYVVYSRVCVNCGDVSTNAILEGVLILLTDHRCLRHRPRYVLRFIPQPTPALYKVSRLWSSEERDQRLCRTIRGETKESAISSRTSNHRLVCLMELFGNWKEFHPRSRRYRELTGSRGRGNGSGGCERRIEDRSAV